MISARRGDGLHLPEAIGRADETAVYDNSRARRPFRLVARFERGRLVGSARWPDWTPAALRAEGQADGS